LGWNGFPVFDATASDSGKERRAIMIDLRETAVDARKKREELKAKRNRLFEQYLRDPSNTPLALEIKAIDDQIAESVERSARKRPVRL
jgi:hypothetical protein